MRDRSRSLCVILGSLLFGSSLPAIGDAVAVGLAAMTLEELMEVEVTLTGRGETPLYETAAAVFVLSADDIRRSGATSIAEALRLIPGMVVARVDANKWAISARGFNGRFANKLLVQIDGRSVYTPTFSGVYWEVQDVVLEDVERIEVIRGPGATLWGANAVNGVINVVTSSADQTQGTLAVAAVGTEERGAGTLRYGGRFGERLNWRIWGKYFAHDGFVDVDGRATADDWQLGRSGLRADWAADHDKLMVQTEAHRGEAGQTFRLNELQPPYLRVIDADSQLSGGHVMGRWHHDISPAASWALQLFYDHLDHAEEIFEDVRDTWDMDFQHHTRWGQRHEVVWGVGYRYTSNQTQGSFSTSLNPSGRAQDVFSGFLQDEMSLASGRARLTAGAKFEHNDYTGFQLQPGVRLWWEMRPRHALWAASSRALRVPSQADQDVRLNLLVTPPDTSGAVPLTLFAILGGELKSEELTAFEVGYRGRPTDQLLLDVTAFFNVYRGVRGGRVSGFYTETDPPPLHLLVPVVNINGLDAETWGIELAADWRNVVADGTVLSCDGEVVLARPEAVRFSGLPRDLLEYGDAQQLSLLTSGSIVALEGGLLTTLYGRFEPAADKLEYACLAFSSADGGFTWQFRAVVADSQLTPGAPEGPNESHTARQPDGRLLCVFRVGSGREYAFYRSHSSDEGRTWTHPQPLENAWSVQPRLATLDIGALTLTGGRPGLMLWVCGDGQGASWHPVNLGAHHNNTVAEDALRFLPEVAAATSRSDPPNTSSYTSMVATGPDEVLISYDRLSNGWRGAPGPHGDQDCVFVVRARVTLISK